MMEKSLLIPLFHNPLKLPALDGKELICEATDVFDHYIDHADLRAWGLNTLSIPSPAGAFKIKQLTRDVTWQEMLAAENKHLGAIALTQAQIVHLCRDYRVYIRNDGHPENILMCHKQQYFMVQVRVFNKKLGIYLYQCLDNTEEHPAAENRLIVPINKLNW